MEELPAKITEVVICDDYPERKGALKVKKFGNSLHVILPKKKYEFDFKEGDEVIVSLYGKNPHGVHLANLLVGEEKELDETFKEGIRKVVSEELAKLKEGMQKMFDGLAKGPASPSAQQALSDLSPEGKKCVSCGHDATSSIKSPNGPIWKCETCNVPMNGKVD